jgi:hypothetical protein
LIKNVDAMGINTNEEAWNGKPDWLEELARVIENHAYANPDILSGHNNGSLGRHMESGAAMIENKDSGQGAIIRTLTENGFIVREIHDNGFYVGKLKDEVFSFSKQNVDGEE